MSKRDKFFSFIGASYCLLGLSATVYMLGLSWLEQLPASMPGRVQMALWLINGSLVVWGLVTIFWRRRESVVNINILFITLFIVIPLTGELFIRSAIALEIEFFRNPRLYAGWSDDDDHWKLRYLWGKAHQEVEGGGFVLDRQLGWAPAKTPQNPLGILAEGAYQPDGNPGSVLFFGDSYVYGMSPTPINQRVPQLLDRHLAQGVVYNYGVVGYGVDQIYLRFQRTWPLFQKPLIIIGLYTLDLDRSNLSFREAPKPYFVLTQNGDLKLNGTPVPDDIEQWLAQHPVTIRSYLAALVSCQARTLFNGGPITELPYKQAEKKALNAKIIEQLVTEARQQQLPLLFVVFYPKWEFNYEGWRELFLKQQLADLGVPSIDTKQLFLQATQADPAKISQFYDEQHGHLNELGGQVVAEAIAHYLQPQEKYALAGQGER
jgi:lysophospholipase L1-like esterase